MKNNPYCAIQLDGGQWAVGCAVGTRAGDDWVLTIERVFKLGTFSKFQDAQLSARAENEEHRKSRRLRHQPSSVPNDRNDLLADLAFLAGLVARVDEYAPECGWLASDELIWLESIRDLLRQECMEIPENG